MVNYKHYTYRVIWSRDDNEYVALCAEFPSLSFLASTQDKALKGIVELVGEVIQDMASSGEDLPAPLSEKIYSGKFQLRVPPELHRHLAMEAAEQGFSLNRYVSSKLG